MVNTELFSEDKTLAGVFLYCYSALNWVKGLTNAAPSACDLLQSDLKQQTLVSRCEFKSLLQKIDVLSSRCSLKYFTTLMLLAS